MHVIDASEKRSPFSKRATFQDHLYEMLELGVDLDSRIALVGAKLERLRTMNRRNGRKHLEQWACLWGRRSDGSLFTSLQIRGIALHMQITALTHSHSLRTWNCLKFASCAFIHDTHFSSCSFVWSFKLLRLTQLDVVPCLSFSGPELSSYKCAGPNGAGKSTLLKLMLQQIEPTVGEALFVALGKHATQVHPLRLEIWL